MDTENVTSERISGSVLIRDVRLAKKGDSIPGHVHKYDHTMFFMKGKARITVTEEDGSSSQETIEAPSDTLLKKNTLHAVKALTDDVYFCCVFPHRDDDGNIVDEPVSREGY